MLGMEMMLSNLIGMKPDEMQKAAKDTITAIESAAANMKLILERLTAIENHLAIDKGDETNGVRKLSKPSECGSKHIQL